MADKLYTKTRVDEDFRITARGELERIMVVQFMVGDDGPFTEEFRPTEFTPEEVRRRLEARAQTIAGIE